MEVQNIKDTDYSKLTVGKIVARDYRKSKVFKKHGIDFCCGGNIKVEEACQNSGADYPSVLSELQAIDSLSTNDTNDYEAWETSKLIDHIISVHHRYVETTIEQLKPMTEKVSRVHGHWRTELHEIHQLFETVAQELLTHMFKEERVLFPAIIDLDKPASEREKSCFGSISNPISVMLHDHDIAGEIMHKIRLLTDNYTLPKGACATYTVMYKTLEEFENDLHKHIHLENNILFPRALQAEG